MRTLAVTIVYEARFNNGYINKQLQNVHHLSNEDMRLLTTICYGSIKQFDYLYNMFEFINGDAKNKPKAKTIIVVAMFQFFYLDKVPTYAILDAAVETAKKIMNNHVATYINAILRKFFNNDEIMEQYQAYLVTLDDANRLAIQYSVPQWLVNLLIAQYGIKDASQFLVNSQLESKQFVRANTLKVTTSELLEVDKFSAAPLANALEYQGGNTAATSYFQEGLISVQNISSQLVAHFVDPQPHEHILDMCAAPGGKTTHLAELAQDKAYIMAYDLYPLRVKQIEQNVTRLELQSVRVKVHDALVVEQQQYDKILLDAPCSGLGVMSQKPEIRYHITPTDLDDLILLQQQLLNSAWQQLLPGGILVYSTCTINRKENEKQVQYLLHKHEDATVIEERLILDEMLDGYSGFYMAKIQKANLS